MDKCVCKRISHSLSVTGHVPMSPAQREGGKHILSAAQGKEGGADVLALTLGNSEITEGSQPA